MVSIPFRYAENRQGQPLLSLPSRVSIPFRYAENGRHWKEWKEMVVKVSIPFRYAENHCRRADG